MVRGRCPCGALHAACGPPSTSVPVDQNIEEVAAVSGPLKKYRYTSEAGHETVLKLNAADAERHGLTDDDLVEAAPAAETKAVTAAPNKARTTSSNKARAPRGKGGEGGGG
jgi:hypothetical protein